MVASERHLLNDLRQLMPHHKVESKLEKKHDPGEMLMEMAELKHCDHVLYFENRKRQDTYMYLGKVPQGPTAKFLCRAIHTMDELKMTGNCIKGSRPLLHFDADFETLPHLQLLRPLITEVFGTQQGHPQSKPFIDHIFCFFHLDGRIWFRNYQIVEERISKKEIKRSLLEVGPRFAIEPIRILSGPFVGHTLFKNETYLSPNMQRATMRRLGQEKQRIAAEQQALKGEGGEQYDE
jgi:ribosome biogenesis protein BRX1